MALHESRKKRLLKLFRRAKNGHEEVESSQTSNATNNSGNWRDVPAIDNSPRNRNSMRAPSPPRGSRIASQRKSAPNLASLASKPGTANYQLPNVPRGRDFSSNFPGLTLEGSQDERDHINFSHGVSAYLDEGHNSEHIADRNMSPSTSEAPTVRLVSQKRQLSKSQSQPLRPLVDQHAGSVADWNMIRNEIPAGASWDEASKPLKVKKRNSNLKAASVESIPGSHMGVIEEAPAARDPSWSTTPLDMEGSHEASPFRHEDSRIRDPSWTITPLALEGYQDRSPFESEPSTPALDPGRASLDKPLPPTPSTVAPRTPTSAQTNDKPFSHSKQDSATPMDLDGAVVYRHPDTTSLHEEQAPAVKHEKVIENDDEVRQKVITREVHDYDIYHRILPIKDIEVKPARHFMQVQDGYVEIDEEYLPGRTREKTNWAIAEFVSKSMPNADGRSSTSARQFTARKFEGTEGDDREYIGADGRSVKEKWWVHPPTLEYKTSGTSAFHFGSKDPENDGLRARLPAGNVVGVSPRLMEKRDGMAAEPMETA